MRLGHQVLEGREIGLAQVALGNLGVEAVPVGLQAGVDGVVLGAGVRLAHWGILRSLQAAHHGHAEAAGQEGILPVGLHAASPAGIAENVDVRRPEGQALIDLDVVGRLEVFDARLVAGSVEDFLHQRLVEARRHADRLREHGRAAVAGDAVQRLAPPVVLLDAQARDGRAGVHGQRRLFLQGQAADQVGGALLRREVLILIGVRLRKGGHSP